jgi:hypothetical protein
MTTLGNGRQRTADWQVQSVFDPGGEGHDFAYTIGLHDRGLPELHLWGRPSLGDDPGADWLFSPHDRTRLLNELAWQLIDGELAIGDSWERPYDDGLVTCRFRLDPPGDRDELEAFGIAPDAQVLPVRWSLHRRPVARPRPLTKRSLQRATSEYAAILAGLGDEVAVPAGWELPAEFVPGGEFGPLTPMVAARVAEFWSADAITLSNLNWAATSVELGGSLTWPATVASAIARDVGRVDEVQLAQDAAATVVESRTEQRDWATRLREVAAAIGFQPGEATPEQIARALTRTLSELLWTVLVTEVVADRLTSAQRLQGRGAWLTGLGPVGELPGPQWRAPRRVLDRLYAALRPLSTMALLELAERHRDEALADYQRLANAAQGWAIVAPAGCPWKGGLNQVPGVIWPLAIDELQEWATVMTSAACHRDRLSVDDVATLTTPFLDLVPELPSVISAGRR